MDATNTWTDDEMLVIITAAKMSETTYQPTRHHERNYTEECNRSRFMGVPHQMKKSAEIVTMKGAKLENDGWWFDWRNILDLILFIMRMIMNGMDGEMEGRKDTYYERNLPSDRHRQDA